MYKSLWEILVPCQMNGKPVRTRHHKEWDKVVRKYSNGLTLTAVAKGYWKNPDTQELVEDRMIPVRFTASKDEAARIAKFSLTHYNQHTILMYKISDEVYFFTNDERPTHSS